MRNQAKSATAEAMRLSREHYENFPVASYLLPRALRAPVAVIYAFARRADDFADEGNDSPAVRQRNLDEMRDNLKKMAAGQTLSDPLFQALAYFQKAYNLPIQLLDDLLIAFSQDVWKTTYENDAEIMTYCQHSANPIGRLLLKLASEDTPENNRLSDAVCTALQRINFLQDIVSDWQERKRCYLPQEQMRAAHIDINAWVERGIQTPEETALLATEWQRCYELLQEGSALGQRLSGRFGLNLRCIIAGGSAILFQLKDRQSIHQRPLLSKPALLFLCFKTCLGLPAMPRQDTINFDR